MIKPPFTVLIIKDSHHPVTIRVTRCFIITILLIPALCIVSGFVISHVIMYDIGISSSSTPSYIQESSENDAYKEAADIKGLNVRHHRNGELEISFGFKSIPENTLHYVWLIVNPDADTIGEIIIYPRSPIFRGLPVDYRNGIEHRAALDREVTITLSEEVVGIFIKQFRILAYNDKGKLLVDKYFAENQETRR